MKRLILLRHAKSSWGDPGLADHDRPLNQRGRLAATLMGAWLADNALRPDLVILSSSARTMETWNRTKAAFADEPVSRIEAQLYHADPTSMRDIARSLPEAVHTAMLIGHNPGVGALARKLSNGSVRASCARAFEKFPTAAVAVFDADIDDWGDLSFGDCEFALYAMPKDLV